MPPMTMTHILCGERFKTLAAFNRHVGTSGPPHFAEHVPECPVLRDEFLATLRRVRLDCGCEPGWRCVKHAKLARNHRADPASEAVVNRVYGGEFRNALEQVVPSTGNPGNGTRKHALTRANARGFVTPGASGGRPKKHQDDAEKQRAYRERKRQANANSAA
jgi:hypothetical protein